MNSIKDFFNKKALTWDQKEIHDSCFFDNFLNEYCDIKLGDKVLDLGCGTGVITGSIFNISKNEVLGLDISDEMIAIAKNKYRSNKLIKFICDDFYNFSYSKFDNIICHNAYPHFLDVESFKNKCFELLADNGLLIIIHSISKEQLKSKHSGLMNISKELKGPEEEYRYFEDKFLLIDKIDNEKMYLLKMKKR